MYTVKNCRTIVLKTANYDDAVKAFVSEVNSTETPESLEAIKSTISIFLNGRERRFQWGKVSISVS